MDWRPSDRTEGTGPFFKHINLICNDIPYLRRRYAISFLAS